MTIRDYVNSKDAMSINSWVEQIKADGLSIYESLILSCADDFNKITVDLSVNPTEQFIKSVAI